MKRFLSVCLIISASFGAIYGKNEKALIYFKDGAVLEVKIRMPRMDSKKITYYDASKKKVKIESSSIDSLVVWNENFGNSNCYTIIYAKYHRLRKYSKEFVVEKPVWMVRTKSNNLITQYTYAWSYSVENNGKFKMTSSGGMAFSNFFWNLYQRPNEEYPTLIYPHIAAMSVADSFLRWYVPGYFEDCPDLVEKVTSKKFNPFELYDYDLFDLYNHYME